MDPELASLTSHVGYPVLVLLVAAESSGVPVPGETALIAASLLAADGQLSIAVVIALAAAAAIAGDNLGYQLGRRYGRRVLIRPGRLAGARRSTLARSEALFDRHGRKAVFFGRWVTGLRIWAAWLAGATHMPWRSFLAWNALGGISWALSVGVIAYSLGRTAANLFEQVGAALAALVVLALVGYLITRWVRRPDE